MRTVRAYLTLAHFLTLSQSRVLSLPLSLSHTLSHSPPTLHALRLTSRAASAQRVALTSAAVPSPSESTRWPARAEVQAQSASSFDALLLRSIIRIGLVPIRRLLYCEHSVGWRASDAVVWWASRRGCGRAAMRADLCQGQTRSAVRHRGSGACGQTRARGGSRGSRPYSLIVTRMIMAKAVSKRL